MMSPFDLAVLGRPSKKKWIPSLESVSGNLSNIVISSADLDVINANGSARPTASLGKTCVANASIGNEVVTVTFSSPSITENFGSFDSIDIAEFGWGEVTSGTGVPPSASFAIDMLNVPPKDSSFDSSVNSTKSSGLMNAANDSIRRLSWKSIERFGHSCSGMEALVQDVAYQEVRKKRFYSAFASVVIVLIFCYVVALFFSSDETAADGISQDESSAYVPKFLIPFHSSPQ